MEGCRGHEGLNFGIPPAARCAYLPPILRQHWFVLVWSAMLSTKIFGAVICVDECGLGGTPSIDAVMSIMAHQIAIGWKCLLLPVGSVELGCRWTATTRGELPWPESSEEDAGSSDLAGGTAVLHERIGSWRTDRQFHGADGAAMELADGSAVPAAGKCCSVVDFCDSEGGPSCCIGWNGCCPVTY
ncbi:hypothetical protein ACLOJK_027162 [Asimina triloba]